MKKIFLLGLVLWIRLSSCEDGQRPKDPPYETNPACIPQRCACPAETRIGGFIVQRNEVQGYTVVDGLLRETVALGQWARVQSESGDCRLLLPRNPFCDPNCRPGEYCDDSGETAVCRPMPAGRDAGRVILRGLSRRLELKALLPSYNYSYTRLPSPGFTPSQVVHLYASGGFFGSFELYGAGMPSALSQKRS